MAIKSKILYICDLNLRHGGAQKTTYKTLECLSREFDMYIYSNDNPSSEPMSVLNELNIYSFFDTKFDIAKIINILIKFDIKSILIQYENPVWLSASYIIKKQLKIKIIIMLHELPYIDTPVNRIIKNWFLLAFVKYFKMSKNLIFKLIDNDKNSSNNFIILESNDNKVNNYTKSHFINILFKYVQIQIIRFIQTYKSIKYADEIIAMGSASKYYIKRYLNINNNIVEIEHNAAVDIKNKVITKNYKYDLCFMASRLQIEKGTLDLLNILYNIKSNFQENINIVIIGRFLDDRTKQNFYDKSKILRLDNNVKMAGFVSEDEKIEILNSSKIFLYPSRKDIFSISLAEALAYGCPAIVFDLPFTWQYESSAVFRVNYKNINQMAMKCIELLRISYNNPNDFQKICENASQELSDKFSWEKTCKDQINAIKRVFT